MVRRATTLDEVSIICSQARVIAFISVEWSGFERRSRLVFADLVSKLENTHADLDVSLWVLHEDWKGIADWFAICNPPIFASSGYGAVVWLENGTVVASENHAAAIGATALLVKTLSLWKVAPSPQ